MLTFHQLGGIVAKKKALFEKIGIDPSSIPPAPQPRLHPLYRADPFSVIEGLQQPPEVKVDLAKFKQAKTSTVATTGDLTGQEKVDMTARRNRNVSNVQKLKGKFAVHEDEAEKETGLKDQHVDHGEDLEEVDWDAVRANMLARTKKQNELKEKAGIRSVQDTVRALLAGKDVLDYGESSKAAAREDSDNISMASRFSGTTDSTVKRNSAGSTSKLDLTNATPRSSKNSNDLVTGTGGLPPRTRTSGQAQAAPDATHENFSTTEAHLGPGSQSELVIAPTRARAIATASSSGKAVVPGGNDTKGNDGKAGKKLWKRLKSMTVSPEEEAKGEANKEQSEENHAAKLDAAAYWVGFEHEYEQWAIDNFPDPVERRQAFVHRMRTKLNAASQDYSPGDPHPRHPETSKGWYHKNLRCTNCPANTECPLCHSPCCAWRRLTENIKEAERNPERATAMGVEEAKTNLKNVEKIFPTGAEVPTFITCSTCYSKVCPRCSGQCPDEVHCKDLQCRKCKKDPWSICEWHADM